MKSTGNKPGQSALKTDRKFLKIKAALCKEISAGLRAVARNQREAAKLIGVSQPDISLINNGLCARFSLERLFSVLITLGRKIVVRVNKATSSGNGGIDLDAPQR